MTLRPTAFLTMLLMLIALAQALIAKDKETVNNSNLETTLALIKPDAVDALYTGEILSLIERNKFTILAVRKTCLSREQAEQFYAEHKGKPFFGELLDYMTSGPLVALKLEKPNAIKEWRTFMGATNPTKADVGTLRRMYGTNLTYNAVHGSDSAISAERELAFFFPETKVSKQ